MKKLEQLYEGKAKKVFKTDDPNLYIVDYKDDATAFNGLKKGTIEGKGIINNRVSNHLMKMLEENGIPTHLVEEISDRETVVKKVTIIPLEVIIRNIAAGSLSKRLGLEEGTKLKHTVLEYCYKDDALGDPLVNDYHIYAMGIATKEELDLIAEYSFKINKLLSDYLKDLNIELWKLGVTAKTQHNEVAPAQHELAPIYETANIAVDHNQLVMETMKKVAGRHGMTCLLHEKPFAGVNGSGKHNNWSLGTDNGVNLLDPGDTPNENIQFLLVLACILKAVDTHADLLRQSASDVGNDHRLGANEAPPAIISVFLGEQLEDVVKQLVETGDATHSIQGGKLLTGVSTLPDLDKDATDRNRTSPFAFTGNKFEFRMVGSADSIASPNTTLNAIVAEAFCEAADILEKADDFDIAVHDLIKKYLTEHQRIIFNGNGYSEEWVEEAARRGLPNIKSMVEASETLTTEKSIKLFEKFGIFTEAELRSREEVLYETYSKTINIEALTMVDMAKKQYIPAVMEYTRTLADTVLAVKSAGADATVQTTVLKSISEKLAEAQAAETALEDKLAEAAGIEDPKKLAFFYKDVVHTAMDDLRTPVDELEMMVDKKVWPVPTYGDLILEV